MREGGRGDGGKGGGDGAKGGEVPGDKYVLQ